MKRFQLSVALAALVAGGALAVAQEPQQTPMPTSPTPTSPTPTMPEPTTPEPTTTPTPMPTAPTADNADATYQDIQATLGFVPQFMRAIPRTYIASFWEGMKNFEMSQSTKLDLKTKELIGLAVASQIPCEYCIQFHTENARKDGATDQEIAEAVGMAAMTRSGSTLLNGLRVDKNQFRRDMNRMEQRPRQQATK